jgi:hypothetical protein
MSLLGFCQWLEQTTLSAAIRESAWAFPIIESVHVLALCFFGMLILIDLRVLGLALKRLPAPEVAEDLAPWMLLGLVVIVLSGILVFLNGPVDYYTNVIFRIKMVLLLLVACNGWFIRAGRSRNLVVARSVSLLLWAGILVAGRMTTYNLFGTN